MKRFNKNETGFGGVEIVLISVIVVLIGVVGFLVYRNHNKTPASTNMPTSSTTSTNTVVKPSGPHSIGYVGCSITEQSVEGYPTVAGNKNLFWPAYHTGGKTITEDWLNTDSGVWKLFEDNVSKYGQPKVLWVQLCQPIRQAITYGDVQKLFDIIKTKTTARTFYINTIYTFNPENLCDTVTNAFVGTLSSYADRAANEGLGIRIANPPTMIPANSEQPSGNGNGCHPNDAAQTDPYGKQLVSIFDSL